MLSFVLGVIGVSGQLIMTRHRLAGWSIALTAQPIWILFALTEQQYGLLLPTAGYTTAAVLGLRAALREKRAADCTK